MPIYPKSLRRQPLLNYQIIWTIIILLLCNPLPSHSSQMNPSQTKQDHKASFSTTTTTQSATMLGEDDFELPTSEKENLSQSKDEFARDLLWKEANLDILNDRVKKRSDYLSWDDYFMSIAFLSSRRSKDPERQRGACIVDGENRIVGIGYNGFPRGCHDDVLPWASHHQDNNILHTKNPFLCDAEVNAILNKCSQDVKNATIYTHEFPGK